jgi:hypothetical protein
MKPRFDDAGLVVGGSSGAAMLHGNTARIDPKKPITPLWAGVMNDYRDVRNTRGFNRLDTPDTLTAEERAEHAKNQVDSHPL